MTEWVAVVVVLFVPVFAFLGIFFVALYRDGRPRERCRIVQLHSDGTAFVLPFPKTPYARPLTAIQSFFSRAKSQEKVVVMGAPGTDRGRTRRRQRA